MNELAGLFWRQGKLDQSIPLFEESLKAEEAARGRQHPETLMTLANLGVNYKDAGRFAEAFPLLEEAYQASRREHSLTWVSSPFLDALTQAAEPTRPESMANVVTLIEELLAAPREKSAQDSPELAGALAAYSLSLIKLKAWEAAERLLRECLAIREKSQPEEWTTFNTQSRLGGVLLGQKEYADAELLLAGYEGMKQRESAIPEQGKVRLPEAIDRLIEFYTATDKSAEVQKWQAERAKCSPKPVTRPTKTAENIFARRNRWNGAASSSRLTGRSDAASDQIAVIS